MTVQSFWIQKHYDSDMTEQSFWIQKQVTSGDADLPVREELGERRRKREMQNVRSVEDENMGSGDENDHGKFEPEEDEFYKEAKQLAEAKKAAKRAKYER